MLSRNGSSSSDGDSHCGIITTANSTLFFDIDPFGGIPSNLIINSIVFGIFIIIFLTFHKKAFRSVNETLKQEKEKLRKETFRIRKQFGRASVWGVPGTETKDEGIIKIELYFPLVLYHRNCFDRNDLKLLMNR